MHGMRSSRSHALTYAVPAEVPGEGLHPLSGGNPAALSLGRPSKAPLRLRSPATVVEPWRAQKHRRDRWRLTRSSSIIVSALRLGAGSRRVRPLCNTARSAQLRQMPLAALPAGRFPLRVARYCKASSLLRWQTSSRVALADVPWAAVHVMDAVVAAGQHEHSQNAVSAERSIRGAFSQRACAEIGQAAVGCMTCSAKCIHAVACSQCCRNCKQIRQDVAALRRSVRQSLVAVEPS